MGLWILPASAARPPTGIRRALEPHLSQRACALWWYLPLCLLVLAVGCGKSRHSIEHVEVSGQVLYGGSLVRGGEVTFVTVKDGFASVGIIDENGNYTI